MKLLTPKEAAQQLRVSTSTLRNWRKQGKGPPVSRVGPASFRYPEEDLQQFIAETTNDSAKAKT